MISGISCEGKMNTQPPLLRLSDIMIIISSSKMTYDHHYCYYHDDDDDDVIIGNCYSANDN